MHAHPPRVDAPTSTTLLPIGCGNQAAYVSERSVNKLPDHFTLSSEYQIRSRVRVMLRLTACRRLTDALHTQDYDDR